jgi:hypothetical protein
MTTRQLHDLLHELDDTHEVVMPGATSGDVVHEVWRAAQDDADDAYAAWRDAPGREPYLAYRAAADRADAALDALVGERAAA